MTEKLEGAKSEFALSLEAREAEGWSLVGHETLTQTKFQQDARFLPETVQTEDDIKEKYLKAALAEDSDSEYEVDLVLDLNTDKLGRLREISEPEEFERIISELRDVDKAFHVYVRKI